MENTVLKCVQWFLSFPVGGSNWKIVGFGALTFRGIFYYLKLARQLTMTPNETNKCHIDKAVN